MPSLKSLQVPLALVAAALLATWWWKSDPPESPSDAAKTDSHSPSRTASTLAAPQSPADMIGRFRANQNRADALQSLGELRKELASMPPAEAVTWIRSFLDSGEDKPTGLTFEINADGTLKEWPTLRTFLLDALLSIDPTAAAVFSRSILAAPTSADEWALALRNVGKVEISPETNSYLRERTEALISNPAWQADPSIGYLNAFDVLVHTNATESTPLLSSLVQKKDRKDLAHAGFLTLDRLVQRNPEAMLTRLAADPALLASRPEMTAQQFARADLRDSAQQEIVKNWLLDPRRTATELRSFAATYPNNNRFVSNNLLSVETTLSGSDLAAHDREALEILHTWAADSAFQSIAETLRTMISRLDGFVGAPSSASPAR